mmetsp:Transcript_13298/g.23396  ORF Transcript_13298/g.23396 Transcript_13298/m.23396 type:complete len:454 (+) Transcript_13298:14-1375(+)
MLCSGPCAHLLLALLLIVAWQTSASTPSDELLQQCFKWPEADQHLAATVAEYKTGSAPRLQLHAIIRSDTAATTAAAAESSVQQHGLTLVTVFTSSRVDALHAQCLSWPGPLVAALYVPVLHAQHGSPSDAIKLVLGEAKQTAHLLAKQSKGCQLTLLVLYEVVALQFLAGLIPINSLRNVAILATSTPLVAMVDVDLLLSASLGQELITGADHELKLKQLEETCASLRFVILPAFQTPRTKAESEGLLKTEMQLAQQAVQGDKAALRPLVAAEKLIPFASQHFRIGHWRTNFPHWLTSDEQFATTFRPQFEPWVIVPRLQSPLYDPRFRGYGRNKQQQVAHAMLARNFSLVVHPHAFLVHRPHVKSAAQAGHDSVLGMMGKYAKAAGSSPSGSGQGLGEAAALSLAHVKLMDRLFYEGIRVSRTGKRLVVHDAAVEACLEMLPWWRGQTVLL